MNLWRGTGRVGRWAFAVLVLALFACGGGDDRTIVVDTSTPALQPRAEPLLDSPAQNDCQVSQPGVDRPLPKPDGVVCTSAGPNSACYQGQCRGLDAQCAAAWSGYTGVWVAGGRNGAPGSCPTAGGVLMCTNTQWSNYCYNYTCPAGYTCTIGTTKMTGPSTASFCNCLAVQNSPTTVYIKDGTPCGPVSEGRIWLDATCVRRPGG